MKRSLKLFACLCFAMLLLISSCLTYTAAALTPAPLCNRMKIHSWEELKMLCDASEGNNDEFLQQLTTLDEQHCSRGAEYYQGEIWHLNFENPEDKAKTKDTFLEMYHQIADLKILVPQDSTTVRLDKITVEQYLQESIIYSIEYQIEYIGNTFEFHTKCSQDYSNFMASQEGEPLTSIDGKGYTVKVWLSDHIADRPIYRAFFIVDGEEHPSFYMQLLSYSYKGDLPEELLSLFGQFRITSAEEILTEMEPSRTWIWVTVAATCAVVIAVIIVVFCKKKKKSA